MSATLGVVLSAIGVSVTVAAGFRLAAGAGPTPTRRLSPQA